MATALPLLDHGSEVLSGDVAGYLFTPATGDGPWPTLLHLGGYDGTAEEVYATVYGALARGYAFAAIDGPGQGSTLYDKRIPMRPDWEHVVPGMVDALVARPGVDASRIVLVGRSWGGIIGPRGASGEPRLAALVVDPGQYDMGDPADDPKFDALLANPRFEAFFAPRMTTHGVTSARLHCADMLRYTDVEAAPKITCPTYVADNETDLVSAGQGQLLFDHLTCPKTFRRFTRAEGAEGHCEGLASALFWAAAFDWLDDTLAAAG